MNIIEHAYACIMYQCTYIHKVYIIFNLINLHASCMACKLIKFYYALPVPVPSLNFYLLFNELMNLYYKK
jgi:hypothetical protein